MTTTSSVRASALSLKPPERAELAYALLVSLDEGDRLGARDLLMDLLLRDLRCLRGYGLCLYRLGRVAKAEKVFLRILTLSPHDNQGVRYLYRAIQEGESWSDFERREIAEEGSGRATVH